MISFAYELYMPASSFLASRLARMCDIYGHNSAYHGARSILDRGARVGFKYVQELLRYCHRLSLQQGRPVAPYRDVPVAIMPEDCYATPIKNRPDPGTAGDRCCGASFS